MQTGAIDDVHKAIMKATDREVEAEGKKIVEGIAKLKYEVQHNRQLTYGVQSPKSATNRLTLIDHSRTMVVQTS